ncbi:MULTISPECIES: Ig-like domain-containing protein [unclassified Pseudodesulfovibrio]|uniref:VCBS domain-containing protein n=1 Tax=unclassified Pseudodesulfovibrio TaxID=2661612 RepID=UPI000FEBB323|nr:MULTISPECIES: Ig-like domain-containing protein [unclassified Pseudodesulfovibrio]MCJ2163463.1 Ig-like domain-containing protein [Pseudodesulfovibrio sp. S3-i]RWU06700.1 tandem-95 repeat protein [Pseudodesulfovibrio sp. S3]
MADSTTQNLHISLPGAGKTQTYQLTADTPVQFDFDLAEAVFTGNNGNLQIAIEGGGTIILENYQSLAEAGTLPTFQMMDGEQVPGDVYLFAFADAEQTAEEVETAADGAAGGSGAGEYNDDPGSLGDGIDALGGQDDAYDGHSLVTLSGILGNVAPTANDDFAEITEQGDPDFIIGRHIVFVGPDQTPDGDTSDGDAAMGEFFPLSTGGGFYIYNPNPPQTDEVIEGNVIDNDNDPDGDDSLLRMFTIDHIGQDHNGTDAPGVEVTSDDTVIMGKYGILVIDADGTWDYTLNQEWADELNEGETYDEVFEYTIVDGLGAESNTATLTITVNGANDMPVAHDDLNVQAVEVGDSTDYDLAANVDDAELGDVTVHSDTDHDYTSSNYTTVHGNVLSGDDFGGATDSDVDSNDSPDGQSLFVVGVYSAATQTVDYELPTEGNADFIPSDDQAYDIATMDPDATVTVNGQYGVLTIEADGDYTYTLYTADDGEAYDALNALNYDNPGTDSFSYGIMDDSGAFSYANLTFTVNGANDAPIAFADTNSVVEFGIKFGDVDDYSATVSGNVIAGDANGGVADTDADNADMFVATVSSQTDESGSLYTSAGDPANQDSVTINGEYGTLTIHADGSYEYTLQNEWDNVQALNEGDNPTDVFTYTLTNSYADGVYSEPVTLTINVIGSNDNPVAAADTNALTESVDDETASFVEGNVLAGDDNGGAADTDVDNVLADFTVTGVEQNGTEATLDTEGYDFVLQGQFGTLYMNEDGTYKYVEDPAATDHLNFDDEPVTDVFTYTMSDNEGAHTGYSSSTLTISISGANDAPVAENDFGVAKEAGFFTDGSDASGNVIDGINLPILGNIGGDSDVDSDTLTVTHVVSDDNPGSQDDVSETGETSIAGKFGTLYIESDGSYRYELDDDADHVNELNVWDVEDESFTYTVTDEHGGSSTATLTIAINGSNDAPAAGDDANTADAVTEQGVNEPGDAVAMGNVLGNDTDIDHNDNSLFVKSIAAGAEGETTSGDASVGFFGRTIEGQYGSLHINRDGSYTYTLNNNDPDTQALAEGQVVHDEFSYTVSDPGFFGLGKATDTATLSIEITGANDAAIITGDDSGAVTEDVDVTAAGLLTDSGQIFASDVDNPDNLFQEITTTDDQGGTFHMGTDGQWTYEISNDSVQHLGEVDGVNDGFTKDFTVKSVDGTEHTVTVTVSGDNDAPLGADFTVQGNNFGEPIGIDFDVAPITDVEDDFSAGDTLDTGVLIDSLPEHGTLYYNGEEVEASDLGVTRYDDLDNFTYVGDAPENQGVLLGSREAGDAGLDTWGEADGNATRILHFDSDGDGASDVTITTTINSGSLKVFADQQNHIDHGLANASHNGLDSGETLTINFDGKDVSYADIGFGGLGSYFNDGSKQDAEATWAVYNDGELIASGTVNNSVMTWTNAITGESGTITGGDGDTFQSLVLDQTILGGESFDQAVFGTTEDDSKDWNANWELQYVDVEFAQTDSFTYRPIDSEGLVNEGDPYVVTVDVLPGAYNEDPTAVADVNSVYEPNTDGLDSSVSANVLVNDIDPDNTPSEMSVTKVIYDGVEYDLTATGQANFNTAYGTMEFNSDGSYTFTATNEALVEGYNPTESIAYTMTDAGGLTSSSTLTITVNGLNDAPVAVDDILTNATEDSGVVSIGTVATGDSDIDTILTDDTLTYSLVTDDPAHPTPLGVSVAADGSVTVNTDLYQYLGEGETETVTFTYQVSDNHGGTDTATAQFTVTGDNDNPTLDLSGGYLTYEGKSAGYNNILCSYEIIDGKPVNPLIIAVFEGGDAVDEQIGDIIATYPDGEAPHYFLVPNVASSVTDASEIELVWVPGDADAGTSGEWNVTVDGSLKDARFDDMNLNPNDSEASFGGDPYHDFEVEADDQLVDGYKTPGDDDDFNDILAKEHDGAPGPDNGPVIFTEGDGPVHVTGAVDISDIDSDNMSMVTITYTPQEGDVLNIDTTGFTSSGPVTDPDTGIVTWTISGDAPKADYEALLQTMTFQNDLDNPVGDDPTTGDIENLRTFTIQVFDDEGAESNTAVASVQVIPVNDRPVATDNADTIDEEGTSSGNVLTDNDGFGVDSDVDGDSLTVTEFTVNGSTYDAGQTATITGVGTLTIGTDGEYTFQPVENYNGTVPTATYTVSDGNLTDTADLKITVAPVNDAPDAVDDGSVPVPIEVGEDAQNFAINVLGNDTDPDLPNDTLEVVSVGTAAHGTVTIGANGQVLYTPDANYNGEDSFTYTIEDAAGASDTATVYVNVTPVNDPPVAVDDTGHADGTGTPVGGDVPTSDYHLVAEASYDDGQTFTTNGASVSFWGQNIGVRSGNDGNGNDKNIENNGSIERLLIVFDDPQTSVDLKLTADGNLEETVLAWDENGNPITDLSVTEANDIITVTSPTTTIGTVVLMADDGESVALKEVVSSSPAPTGDVDNVIPVIEGNVLANDYDAEDTDYPETDDPTTSTLEGSTELTVTGIAAGDLDDQLGAELTQDNDEGSIMDGFDGHIGNTFTPAGESVQGQFGVLEIGADGEYTYTPNDGIAPGDYAETFTYQVSDTDGAVDYGTINVSVTVPVLNTAPTAIDDLYDTTTGYNVVTEDGGSAIVGSAPNYLVVLDTSGSMDEPNVAGGTETRLDVAKAALVEMMETLQAQVNETGVSVTVGIVDFDYHHDGTNAYTNTFTLTRNTDLNDLSNDAIDYINNPSNLIASGGTDYNDAFSAANAWVANEGANGNSNEVIFISDGDPHYYYHHWLFGVQQGDFAPGEDNYGTELTALQNNANVTAVGIAMSGSAEDRMDAIDESSDGAIFLTSATGLNDVLTDVVASTMPTPMTTASGNVIDGHDDSLGQTVGEDIDDDGDTISVISVGRGQEGSETDVILLTDTVNDDADTATMVGQFGTLTINADGSYEYTPDQPASDALSEGQTGRDFFTYTISDGNGGTDTATVSFLIHGANDAPVAVDDLGHGVFVTDTLQTVETYGWSTELASHINFNDTSGNDKWTKVDDRLGLRVSASTEDGHNASVEQTWNGIGVNTKNTFDSGQIASTNSHGKETLTLDFGNHTNNSDHEMPLGVKIMLGEVSGFGEQVILTVTDSEGNTTTVTGTNGMSHISNGITISNYGAANEWFVTGAQGDTDGNGQVLIDTISITAGNNASFTLYAMEVTNASDWVVTGSTTTGTQTAAQVSGYVLGNDFDAENDAMTAAIVGSGVGLWGTLTMAADGAWTYDPNETAIFDDNNGLNGPAVEQFTYQVTDAHGLTDTATLYVPLHYNTTATTDGTSGDDVVYGTSGDDIISGLEGNDFLYGEAGNDHIDGGLGHDYISGGDGNDVLNGGDGNDMLFGGNGNDTIWGGAGDDIISAGSGDDSVYISSGHDTVTLGAGADTIHIDPSYLTSGDGGGHMTVTDFNAHGGDLLDLSSLTSINGATAAITSSSGSENLVLTINNVNGDGDGITITLEGVMSAAHTTDISQTVDISHDDVNTLIQHIIDSPDSY